VYYAGFAALPWFWAVNAWLHWPSFAHGQDLVLQQRE
jgi:hypothetical protein